MMREHADVIDLTGNHLEANDLRCQADKMVKAVMTLYEHAPQRTLAEMRHCYDLATIGRFMAADLPPTVRHEMVEFVQHELLIEKWMRGQSMLDMAAANSDGPDHGPMGAQTMHGPQSP